MLREACRWAELESGSLLRRPPLAGPSSSSSSPPPPWGLVWIRLWILAAVGELDKDGRLVSQVAERIAPSESVIDDEPATTVFAPTDLDGRAGARRQIPCENHSSTNSVMSDDIYAPAKVAIIDDDPNVILRFGHIDRGSDEKQCGSDGESQHRFHRSFAGPPNRESPDGSRRLPTMVARRGLAPHFPS